MPNPNERGSPEVILKITTKAKPLYFPMSRLKAAQTISEWLGALNRNQLDSGAHTLTITLGSETTILNVDDIIAIGHKPYNKDK